MNDKEFDNYLKKYKNLYKIKKKEDGCLEIVCLRGNFIYLFSIRDKILCFYFSGGKDCRAKNVLRKKLKESGNWHEICQEGDLELTINFKEADLTKFEKIFKICKKRQYSPEYKQKLIERAKMMNPMRRKEGDEKNGEERYRKIFRS